MATSNPRDVAVVTTGAPAPPLEAAAPGSVGGPRLRTLGRRSEFLYFALRNWKFAFGAGIVLFFLAVAVFGPMLTAHKPLRALRALRAGKV